MRRVIVFAGSAILLGCAAAPQPKPQSKATATQQYTDYNDYASRFIPEAGGYIDYSEDFYSWHYHGRDREPKTFEVTIYELQQQINIAKEEGDDERLPKLQMALKELEAIHGDDLKNLAKLDQQHYAETIKEMIASKNTDSGAHMSNYNTKTQRP